MMGGSAYSHGRHGLTGITSNELVCRRGCELSRDQKDTKFADSMATVDEAFFTLPTVLCTHGRSAGANTARKWEPGASQILD